jgi:hypothetical protein
VKNSLLRSVVLLALWSLAACGTDGTVTGTNSSDGSAAVATAAVGAPTTEVVDRFSFTPPAGDYAVMFPAEPKANEQALPLPDGTSVPFTTYITESTDMVFATTAIAYPSLPAGTLEAARDGAIGNVSGTQTSSELTTLQGREGLQFTASVQSGQGTVLGRLFVDDATLYQVVAVVSGDVAFDDLRVAAFFDSFRFTAA